MRYRPEIDGLRAIAVLPVILFHAGLSPFSGGFVGVDIFFVISGYLITSIIAEELAKGQFSLRGFYVRRARRILPALFLVALCTIPAAWFILLPREMKDFSQSLVAIATFSSNFLFWMESGYFDTSAELKPMLHTWSLAVEEQFYMLFPLFLMAVWSIRRRSIITIIVLISAISLAAAEWAAYAAPSAAFYLLPTRCWELLAGSLVAFWLRDNPPSLTDGLKNVLSLAGVAMIAVAVFTYDDSTPFPGLFAVPPVLGTVLVILFTTKGTALYGILSSRAFVGIGLISYSAYLWHQPVFALIKHETGTIGPVALILSLTFVFAASIASWKFVEVPARYGRISAAPVYGGLAFAALFIVAVGVKGHVSHGNIWRFDDEVVAKLQGAMRHSSYTWRLKHEFRLARFADPEKGNLLIIGDSNSGDLMNALEIGFGHRYELSSVTIPASCGNLYIDKREIETLRVGDEKFRCPQYEDYETPVVRKLISDADVVLIASAWQDWEVERLPASISKLEQDFGKKFFVFGTKHIEYDERGVYERRIEELAGLTATPRPRDIETNAMMQTSLADRFLDPFRLICSGGVCPVVSHTGEFVFYDGFHLTEYGAAILSENLKRLNYF